MSVRRRLRELVSSDIGSSAVELAVALPMVVLLAIGVADYARVYYTTIVVTNAARAGAQFGVFSDNVDSIKAAVQADAAPTTMDTVQVTEYCRCPDGTPQSCTTGSCGTYGAVQSFDSVRVRKDVAMIFNYPGLPATIPVIRFSVMRGQ